MRTTAGVKVPLSSLLATGAEVAIFLSVEIRRVGSAFGLLFRLKGYLVSLQQVIDLLLKGFNFFRDRGGMRKLFGC
jgi:hypothetical protein